MIKILEAHYAGNNRIELIFSDGQHGIFDLNAYLSTRQGPLLESLHQETYLQRFFINAGALCWPNGLELSPDRLHELTSSALAPMLERGSKNQALKIHSGSLPEASETIR
ncbi:MAG: DUF2442 domain-containing protein [Candidatus Competibacteraceae bacterium]